MSSVCPYPHMCRISHQIACSSRLQPGRKIGMRSNHLFSGLRTCTTHIQAHDDFLTPAFLPFLLFSFTVIRALPGSIDGPAKNMQLLDKEKCMGLFILGRERYLGRRFTTWDIHQIEWKIVGDVSWKAWKLFTHMELFLKKAAKESVFGQMILCLYNSLARFWMWAYSKVDLAHSSRQITNWRFCLFQMHEGAKKSKPHLRIFGAHNFMTYDLEFGKGEELDARPAKILQVSVTWLAINSSVWLSNNAAIYRIHKLLPIIRTVSREYFHINKIYKQVTFGSAKVTEGFSEPTS